MLPSVTQINVSCCYHHRRLCVFCSGHQRVHHTTQSSSPKIRLNCNSAKLYPELVSHKTNPISFFFLSCQHTRESNVMSPCITPKQDTQNGRRHWVWERQAAVVSFRTTMRTMPLLLHTFTHADTKSNRIFVVSYCWLAGCRLSWLARQAALRPPASQQGISLASSELSFFIVFRCISIV